MTRLLLIGISWRQPACYIASSLMVEPDISIRCVMRMRVMCELPVNTCSGVVPCRVSSCVQPAASPVPSQEPAAAGRVVPDIGSECSRRSPRSVEGILWENKTCTWKAQK